MTRAIAYGLGVSGLVGYAILRVALQHRPVLPAAVGAALGLVVLWLLARRPR
ncbi:MAG TPA: hypothetical protein VFL66_08865 [Gaiellaceae bacterium]|nr:hypothetical protein [Gaiellaceae bacterium]